MRGLVAYDSVYGNTKQIADAIAEEIKAAGHEAQVMSVKDEFPDLLAFDFVFVGSPTRIANASRASKRFVKKLSAASWGGKPVIAFDTIMPGVLEAKGRWTGTAAQVLHDLGKNKGLNVRDPVLHTYVKDMKGPLADDAVTVARAYTKEFLAALHQ
jgi:flavodoxin